MDNGNFNKDNILIVKIPNSSHYQTIIKDVYDKTLLKMLKQKLGCGGSLTNEGLVLQGKQKNRVIEILESAKLHITNKQSVSIDQSDEL